MGICPLTPCFLVSSPKWSSATLDFWFFIIVHPPVLDKFFHLLTVGSLCYELNILTFMVVILSPVYTIPYSFTLCLHFILFKNLLLKWLTYSIVFLVYCKVIQLYTHTPTHTHTYTQVIRQTFVVYNTHAQITFSLLNSHPRASLLVQWLGIHLVMQGTRVQSQVREDPTCHGATKPLHHNY